MRYPPVSLLSTFYRPHREKRQGNEVQERTGKLVFPRDEQGLLRENGVSMKKRREELFPSVLLMVFEGK
jgi:hypothetical protein